MRPIFLAKYQHRGHAMIRLTLYKTRPNTDLDWTINNGEFIICNDIETVDFERIESEDGLSLTQIEDYETWEHYLAADIEDEDIYLQSLRYTEHNKSLGMTSTYTLVDTETGEDLSERLAEAIAKLYPNL